MTVRAKFTVQSITRQQGSRYVPAKSTGHHGTYETCELQTLKLTPVYDPEPGSENHEFWAATPTGSIELSTVNAEAGNYFELGQEYYIDFTKVGEPAPQG
jgi:hypothetical protein